jgi:hypothetical protein
MALPEGPTPDQKPDDRLPRQIIPTSLEQSFAAAILQYSTAEWGRLNPKEQAAAVYGEMRRLDADAVVATLADTTE